ncbi:MAG TPA: AI-2E family transporter [Pyrinomonadaceae bacterium]|nr:AI-2E family transporter [Pyrinomonadaceae bacterium]
MPDKQHIHEVPPNENIGGESSADIQRVALVSSSPSARSIVRVVVIVLLLLAVKDVLVLVVTSLTYLLFMVILAILFAYLINPLVDFIHRPFKEGRFAGAMPRPAAIALSFLIVIGIVSLAIASLAPTVAEQAKTFVNNIPTYTTDLQSGINDFNGRLDRMRVSDSIQTTINERLNSALDAAGTAVTAFLTSTAIFLVTYLPWLVLIPILAFFFLKDASMFRLALLRMFPAGDWRMRVDSVVSDVNATLAAYTRAQTISCLMIGVVCTIGFYILGNNYALLLGVMAGVFEFVPIIGPLAIAIIATTVAGFESGLQALLTALFLGVLRIAQDYAIYPRIIREGVHLHPLAVILSVLAGEQVAGIPGVFIAIPLVALGTVLYKHVLEHTDSRGIITGLIEASETKEEAAG